MRPQRPSSPHSPTFDRGKPVALPLATTEPNVKSDDVADAATQARTALSAPIRLSYGETRCRVPRWRIAALLSLPSGGTTAVSISGRGAEQYLERLSAAVSRKPQDAHFQVTATGKIVIRPSAPGLQLDLPATAKAIVAAAFSADRRTANSSFGSPIRSGRRRSRRRWASPASSPRTRRPTAARRAAEQRAARRRADRRHADRAG